ncbi:MAG: 2-oxoacid:acceptor oxidoreductase family protein, partial [Rhodospirillales bacterium]|nr:2-oxoacid:acceptor oxidoreductase family protein [Rhodospirillales bacterium]
VDATGVDYPLLTQLDYLVVLDELGLAGSLPLLKPGALVISDERLVPSTPKGDFTHHALGLTDKAIALGSHRVANIIGLGLLVGLSGICPRAGLEGAISEMAPKKFLALNLEAMEAGFTLADEIQALPGAA